MYTQCLVCASEKLVPNVRLEDDDTAYSSRNHQVTYDEQPQAIFFKGSVRTRLAAVVCADCGYTALFAESPHTLYDAYLQSQAK